MSITYSTVGNTIEFDIDIKNSDREPVVLTGSTFTFNAADTARTVLITKTDGDGIEVDNAVTGRLRITLEPDDTSIFVYPVNLWWDLTMVDLFDAVRTVAKGRIALSIPVV